MTVILQKEFNLKKSPMYNLSLCSLENFHSSFWLCLSEFSELNFSQYLNIFNEFDINTSIIHELKVEREVNIDKNHRVDLLITINNGERRIFIENKLKSIPKQQQLEAYKKAVEDKYEDGSNYFLLISFKEIAVLKDWRNLSYRKLANNIKNLLAFNLDDYHRYLIKDYHDVLKHLLEKYDEIEDKLESGKYNFYKVDEKDFPLRDTYIKYKTDELCSYIINNKHGLRGETSFNNKKGTISFSEKIRTKNLADIYIGIQIEHEQYRYFMVIPENKSKRELIAKEILKKGLWFNSVDKTNSKMRGLTKESIDNPVFCHYETDLFIYRYSNLSLLLKKALLDEVTYDEIADKVREDMDHLKEKLEEICQVIDESKDSV